MADSSTLDDLLKGVSRNSLKAECSDEHLIKIAKWFKHWKDISADLGLTEAEEEEIEARVGDLNRKKLDMLRKWKSKYVAKANYLKLAEVFHDHGYNDLVVKLCNLIPSVEDDGSSNEAERLPNPQPQPVSCGLTPSELLRTNYSKLVEAIQDPESLADFLYSGGVIARKVNEDVCLAQGVKNKNRVLLAGVEQQVGVNPGAFQQFKSAVLRDPSLKSIWPVFDGSKASSTPAVKGAGTNGPSIHELLDKVKVTSKWRMIGIGLGISSMDLDAIQSSTGHQPNSTQQALEKVFTIWQEKVTSPYNWSTLIYVLKQGYVGETRLAQELERM
eukprot:Em0014g362a